MHPPLPSDAREHLLTYRDILSTRSVWTRLLSLESRFNNVQSDGLANPETGGRVEAPTLAVSPPRAHLSSGPSPFGVPSPPGNVADAVADGLGGIEICK